MVPVDMIQVRPYVTTAQRLYAQSTGISAILIINMILVVYTMKFIMMTMIMILVNVSIAYHAFKPLSPEEQK